MTVSLENALLVFSGIPLTTSVPPVPLDVTSVLQLLIVCSLKTSTPLLVDKDQEIQLLPVHLSSQPLMLILVCVFHVPMIEVTWVVLSQTVSSLPPLVLMMVLLVLIAQFSSATFQTTIQLLHSLYQTSLVKVPPHKLNVLLLLLLLINALTVNSHTFWTVASNVYVQLVKVSIPQPVLLIV
jgi:hypothetical protein